MLQGVAKKVNPPGRSCALVLLSRNEAQTIRSVIESFRASLAEAGLKLVMMVLADDSSDDTPKIAAELGAVVIGGGGLGLGTAYRLGVQEALKSDAELIVTCDADGQADPREIETFIRALDSQRADMVVGSRFAKGHHIDYPYPPINRLGVKMLSVYLTLATGQRFTDSHGGIRIMRRALAERLKIVGHHTYVQEAILSAVQNGFRVVEIPSCWHQRQHGESRILKSLPRYIRRTAPILLRRSLDVHLARLRQRLS